MASHAQDDQGDHGYRQGHGQPAEGIENSVRHRLPAIAAVTFVGAGRRKVLEPDCRTSYADLTLITSECPHAAHSKVRRSCPWSPDGSMRASSVRVPQRGHGGRYCWSLIDAYGFWRGHFAPPSGRRTSHFFRKPEIRQGHRSKLTKFSLSGFVQIICRAGGGIRPQARRSNFARSPPTPCDPSP